MSGMPTFDPTEGWSPDFSNVKEVDGDREMRWCPCKKTGCVPLLMKAAGGWMECGHCGQEVDHEGVELPSRSPKEV